MDSTHRSAGRVGPPRRARRRASFVVVGALVLGASACGPLGGDSESSSSSSYEPVEPTTTTEPTTSSSSTPTSSLGPRPEIPKGEVLIQQAKDRMASMNTVTIDGTFYAPGKNEKSPMDDVAVTLHTEGSAGSAYHPNPDIGNSKTTLTLENGGRLDFVAKGYDHYIRANDSWFTGIGASSSEGLAEHAGRWIRIGSDDSPLKDLRPKQMLKGSFFGDALTLFDAEDATTEVTEYQGKWVYELTLNKAGETGADEPPRSMLVSAKAGAPDTLALTHGQNPSRTEFTFTKWNTTSDDIAAPKGAKQLKQNEADDGLGLKAS